MNSRNKGKRGERMFRDWLRALGFLKARRGQQFSGGPESPDVVCPEIDGHFEVKFRERGHGETYQWVAQAKKDAKGRTTFVAHKMNHGDWLFTMHEDDFARLLLSSDLILQRECISDDGAE